MARTNEIPKPRDLGNAQPAIYHLKKDLYWLDYITSLNNDSNPSSNNLTAHQLIDRFFQDKGYHSSAIRSIGHQKVAKDLFHNLMVRENTTNWHIDNYCSGYFPDAKNQQPHYFGTPLENIQIDSAIAEDISKSSYTTDNLRSATGYGAATTFEIGKYFPTATLRILIGDTPVVIIGGGPAGIIAANSLISVGFKADRIFNIDPHGYGGIWSKSYAYEASRNNPRQIKFADHTLEPAPGSGRDITQMMTDLSNNLQRPIHGTVTKVIPGDLLHEVEFRRYKDTVSIQAPIVINASGLGQPSNPNLPGVMTTNATLEQSGVRHQEILTEYEAKYYSGKMITFIGLGNSTAEMLVQISRWNAKGYGIDYRVLTHLPAEMIDHPTQTFIHQGKSRRLFRDLSVSHLTGLAGDLPEIRGAFFEAKAQGKILTDVTHWEIKQPLPIQKPYTPRDKTPGIIQVVQQGIPTETIEHHQLYTLTGNTHDTETLTNLGINMDPDLNCIRVDYDGEFQRSLSGSIGRDRLYPGYMGLGAVLQSPYDRNAVTIPGMLFRLPDMLLNCIIRAIEFNPTNGQSAKLASLIK